MNNRICIAPPTLPTSHPNPNPHPPEIAQVIAPYTATGAEQLTLAPGQLILIRKKNPGGWWEGELQVCKFPDVAARIY